jgi:hypothetical protein
MGFSIFVEAMNLRLKRTSVPVHLHNTPYDEDALKTG